MAKERILIVEGEAFHGEVLRRFLSGRGYEALVAGPAASCDAVRSSGCDLVVLGELAEGRGLAFLERLVAVPDLAHVPVVFLAGYQDPAGVARAYDAGADVAVAKPVDLSLLFRQIRATIRRATASSALDEVATAG